MHSTQCQSVDLHMNVYFALCRFFHEDRDLLHLGVHEQSITHKLAEHLQSQFADLKVDCEYNRHEIDPKELCGAKIIPDIVVHKRGCNCSNALVIEVKKSNADTEKNDKDKLRGMTNPASGYGYTLGLFLVFDVRNKALVHAECYQGGMKRKQCPYCEILAPEFTA